MSLQQMFLAVSPGGGIGDAVSILGGTLGVAINFESPAKKLLKFDNDGNIYFRNNDQGAFIQMETSAGWLRPTSSAPGLYECRFINKSGDGITTSATENTWSDLTADYEFYILDTSFDDGAQTATFTVEIRLDGGSVLESGVYTISANLLT